jgi:hypothetical protein
MNEPGVSTPLRYFGSPSTVSDLSSYYRTLSAEISACNRLLRRSVDAPYHALRGRRGQRISFARLVVDGRPRHSGSAVSRGAARGAGSPLPCGKPSEPKNHLRVEAKAAPRQRRTHKISVNPQHASKAGLVRRAALLAARGLSHVTSDDCRSAASDCWKCSGAGLG